MRVKKEYFCFGLMEIQMEVGLVMINIESNRSEEQAAMDLSIHIKDILF
jgi:hypothetical protein